MITSENKGCEFIADAWAVGGSGRDFAVAQANLNRFPSFLWRHVAIICTYHRLNLQGVKIPRRNQYV